MNADPIADAEFPHSPTCDCTPCVVDRAPIPHDGTRLGKQLQELEESDPEVKRAALRLQKLGEDARFRRFGLTVNPKNLQLDPECDFDPGKTCAEVKDAPGASGHCCRDYGLARP